MQENDISFKKLGTFAIEKAVGKTRFLKESYPGAF